jgi:hypothetical protein
MPSRRLKRQRDSRANTLALVGITALLLLALLFFGLNYVNVLRGDTSQKTAIESAALTAAKDISRIVVNTPQFGWVGLTEQPPIGAGTVAQDNWNEPVHGINELMATARLDMIIADQIPASYDPHHLLKQLAADDYKKVKAAKDLLYSAINTSLTSAGCSGQSCPKDIYGNSVPTYNDTLTMYNSNQSSGSTLSGSFKLTLGGIVGGIQTCTPSPNPGADDPTNSSDQRNGYYLSDANFQYDGNDYVFAAVGTNPALSDISKFPTTANDTPDGTVAGLPYQMPAAVRVDADQQFQSSGKQWTSHFKACATAGGTARRPAPGAFTLSFPDGPLPEFTQPGDVFTNTSMQSLKCDVLSADGGDFPGGTGHLNSPSSMNPQPWTMPAWQGGQNPPPCDVALVCFYDWVRAGGSDVSASSINSMLTAPFNSPPTALIPWISHDPGSGIVLTLGNIPAGIMHSYTFNGDGTIQYNSQSIKPYRYSVVSNNQMYAELQGVGSGGGQKIPTTATQWAVITQMNVPQKGNQKVQIVGTQDVDVYFRDFVHQTGSSNGGLHSGEPLDFPQPPPTGSGGGSSGGGGGGPPGAPTPGTTPQVLSHNGQPPVVSNQTDFATSTTNPPAPYAQFSTGGGGPRPTYTTNGVCADIRFRRQIDVGQLVSVYSMYYYVLYFRYHVGYVGEML